MDIRTSDTYIYIDLDLPNRKRACMHMSACVAVIRLHVCKHMHAPLPLHMQTRTCTLTCECVRSCVLCVLPCARAHTHVHTRTHTHIHTQRERERKKEGERETLAPPCPAIEQCVWCLARLPAEGCARRAVCGKLHERARAPIDEKRMLAERLLNVHSRLHLHASAHKAPPHAAACVHAWWPRALAFARRAACGSEAAP